MVLCFTQSLLKIKKINRKKLILYLETHGIETRYMMLLLNQPIHKKLFINIEYKYPVTKYINNFCFIIGCHHYLKKDDLDDIVSVLNKFFNN
ncbi:MAG: DegT/DnrJ/EryC1/StrS family aminotransferase [Candidatus Omnitrophica bacterium]|nr:DegT/DnrJ/EryC1/StrS family aminotransferase [Candidatus Omnitrophota bacterium]